MGLILPSFKNAIYQDILNTINSSISHYYAFAANPIINTNSNVIQPLINNDYNDKFTNDWNMIFGKQLTAENIMPVINNNTWVSGTIYDQYDNTSNTLYTNLNFYVVVPPAIYGSSYNIYVCINNANGSPSIVAPSAVQYTTFETNDGYFWKYITSISNQIYNNFSTSNYIPVYPNTIIQSSASLYAGIDNVIITNGGQGYATYLSGTIQGGTTTLLQLDSYAVHVSGYYNNNSIYVTGPGNSGGQLKIISSYIANSSGNWAILNSALTNVFIGSVAYNYYISPQIYFNTDGITDPEAYSVINSVSNSISDIVILNNGSNISWANVSIITNNALVTVPATLYAVVPPPGGHGYDPVSELSMQGISFNFSFSNTEFSTIPTNIGYNKVGIIKNPISSNSVGGPSNNLYNANTFNQLLVGTTTIAFNLGDQLYGQTSNALGTVAFSNSTTVYLTGDKYFENNEIIISTSNSLMFSTFNINSYGNLYTKYLTPLYISNIPNINRSNTSTETFKLVVEL